MLFAGFLLAASPAIVSAANPSLGGMSPRGGQRGAEVEVVFNGARLADAQEILFYYPGIKVNEFAVVGDNQVKTKLAITPDCRLGIHAVRIRTASGISDLKTFNVGALPEVPEVEPNNDFAAPQKINLGVTVTGVVQNEDVDYFLVEAKQGERITAEIEGIRLGATFFDPYVAILDLGRFELSSSDDSALVWQDGVASIAAPKDGTYVIQVRETSFKGDGNSFYRLHVGRFPRPMATVPAGGKPGETVQVRWLGDVLGERAEPVTLPQQVTRAFGIFAQDAHGIAPSPNAFRISDLGNVVEVEPNNAAAEATPFAAPMALNGVIGQPGD
ncbi:MAG: PPC domain-containing protein, partial [Pirellulales bacterium]